MIAGRLADRGASSVRENDEVVVVEIGSGLTPVGSSSSNDEDALVGKGWSSNDFFVGNS